MSRTQPNLGDTWKNNKSSPQSEKPLILYGCSSTWRLIHRKGLKQLRTSPAISITNLLFSNKQNVRWHQVSLKWDFSSPALTASHLPSLPWRTWYRSAEVKPGRTQVTFFPPQMEGLHIHKATSAFCRKDDFFTWKIFISATTTTWGGEVAMRSGRQETRNRCWVLERYPCHRNTPRLGFVFSWPKQGQDFQSLYFHWQIRGISSSVTSRKSISCTKIWSASAPASRPG